MHPQRRAMVDATVDVHPPAPPPQGPDYDWHATPRLLASTGSVYSTSLSASHTVETPAGPSQPTPTSPSSAHELNAFKSLQWTPDGTSIVTVSEDHGLRSWILPPTLLAATSHPLALSPYTRVFPGTPIYSVAVYPRAQLSSPQTFVALVAARDQPLRLHSLLHPTKLASYRLINASTEKYETPAALLFDPSDADCFVAGTASQIAFFDVRRDGCGPVGTVKTTPTRRSPMTSHTMKGVVSALALGDQGVLAAGTWSRCVGLYGGRGRGDVVGCWQLEQDAHAGGGVSSLAWGGSGERYLFVSERRGACVQVYDIRVSGKRVETLRGRRAETNQRCQVQVTSAADSQVVVAGGVDGGVRVWDVDAGGEPVGGWTAHGDVVSGVGMHPTGAAVLATCSGSRKAFGLPLRVRGSSGTGGSEDSSHGSEDSSHGSEDSSDGGGEGLQEPQPQQGEWDASLKIWEIPFKPVVNRLPTPTISRVEAPESREHP